MTEIKKYEPSKIVITEKKTVTPGSMIHGKVVLVEEGQLQKFIPELTLKEKWPTANPLDPCIQVTAQSDDASVNQKIVLSLPKEGNSVHPKSKLAKWIGVYGGAPYQAGDIDPTGKPHEQGQKVYFMANGKGYFQFNV